MNGTAVLLQMYCEFLGSTWWIQTVFRSSESVSYTHLDVYKRQIIPGNNFTEKGIWKVSYKVLDKLQCCVNIIHILSFTTVIHVEWLWHVDIMHI